MLRTECLDLIFGELKGIEVDASSIEKTKFTSKAHDNMGLFVCIFVGIIPSIYRGSFC